MAQDAAAQDAHADVTVLLDGKKVEESSFVGFRIERDMYQPDHATIEVSNQGSAHAGHKVGDSVEIKIGDGADSLFKGQITGLSPLFKGGGDTKITIQAMNKLHKLVRGRHSKTFQDKTDQQIISEVVQSAGLTLEWKHDQTITYKHVYQHNQTNLEFLRMRAARLGCHIWCVDTKVFVKQPDLGASQALELHCDKAGSGEPVRWFRPKLDSSGIVKKVTVRGWDPEKKEEIVGEASIASSPLASKNASAASNDLGNEETFIVDQPIWSKQEANAIAKAKLTDAALSYITGDVEIAGNSKVDLGKSIKITVKSDANDPFSGKYYVMGIVHTNRVEKKQGGKGGDGGFHTQLRLARDGQDS